MNIFHLALGSWLGAVVHARTHADWSILRWIAVNFVAHIFCLLFFFCKLQLNDFFISVVVGKYHSMPEALWALSMSTPFISVPSSNYYGSLVQWWCRLGRKRNSVLISTETRDRFFTQLLLLFGVSSNQSHRKCRPHANKSPQYQCLIISAQCFVHSNWNKRNNACRSPGCHRNRAFRVQRR